MPYSFAIDIPSRVVFSRIWGTLTDEQAVSHAKALKDDPRFDPGFSQIIDMRELTDVRMTSAGTKDLAHVVPFRPTARRAFLVGTGEAEKLSKVLFTYTKEGVDQYVLFRDLPSAMQFVGLNGKTPWPDRTPDQTFGSS